MIDTTKKFCSTLFEVIQQKGITDVVCSPGSRNVPLILAVASRTELKKHFVIDERSAAFYGLGISQISQKPVVLICTSGTALLNYAPAIAEAYYQAIPLIVISADRPVQWIDQDDSQTLRQDGAIANYVKKSFSIPALGEDDPQMLWYVNRIANDAVTTAITGRKGPVHINVHISEPLGNKVNYDNSRQRIVNTIESDAIANKEVIKEMANEIHQSKVLLVAGFNQPDSKLQKAITDFSRFPNVVTMAETISNLHLKDSDYSIDSVLTSYSNDFLDKLAPDIVLSIGGSLVSRKLKEYLRRNSNKCKHWAIGYSHSISDPFMSLSLRIETNPARFFRNLTSILRKIKIQRDESVINYNNIWNQLRINAFKIKNKYIDNIGWSELKVFDILLKNIPSDYNLFLSNGTPIRYAQIINYHLPHASYCNRGVSGIDGSTSTAIGGATAYKGNTILITGDLSFSYDIGGITMKGIPDSFKIVVIDNQGGGIFRFIPSTSSLEEREEYLCQSPNIPYKLLAQGYEWVYYDCDNEKTLKEIFPKFLANKKKSILKITCPGISSAEYLRNYMTLTADNFPIGGS